MALASCVVSSRGLRVSFTRSCKVQTSGIRPLSTPGFQVPFESLDPLRSRAGVYVKYMVNISLTGFIWIRGDQRPAPPLGIPRDSYPLKNEAPASDAQQRRSRVIFLPITARVPVYAQQSGAEEGATAIEF